MASLLHLIGPATAEFEVEVPERRQAFSRGGSRGDFPGHLRPWETIVACLQERGEGKVLDQFSNQSNPLAHYKGTGPELWEQTGGRITHFVSSMGTTG
jgi:cysteine synthase B